VVTIPDHNMHRNIDRLFLDGDYPEVHSDLDMWSTVLQSDHRRIYHDWKAVVTFWRNTNNILKTWSAYYHIILDKISEKYGKECCLAIIIEKYRDGSIDQFDPENPELPEWTGEFFIDWEDWNDEN